MTRFLFMLMMLFTMAGTGCSAVKARTGEYVTEAVVDHLTKKFEEKLDERGLSIAEITSVVDVDQDGKMSSDEVKSAVKDATLEALAARTSKLQEEQRAEWDSATSKLQERLTAKLTGTEQERAQATTLMQDLWAWIKAGVALLVFTLLSQLWGHHKQGKTSSKLVTMEKLLQRDLDGDGHIGAPPEPAEPEEDDLFA